MLITPLLSLCLLLSVKASLSLLQQPQCDHHFESAAAASCLEEGLQNGANNSYYSDTQDHLAPNNNEQEVFELFADFDIGHLIQGNETFDDILDYRNTLQRPSLSFYVDKVARKRWLPHFGYNIPHEYSMQYLTELEDEHGTSYEEQEQAIFENLPYKKDYAAKPTHMSLSNGNWLVQHEDASDTTRFSNTATEVVEDDEFHGMVVAESLVESLHSPPHEIESWALKNVQPGYVVEERWTAHDNDYAPPHEFCIFTIWGRVWVAQWNYIQGDNRWSDGFIYRNGTFTKESLVDDLPDWLDWDALVELAEELGAHKDMFRVDVFVGVPAIAAARDGATVEERKEQLQMAVSESEIFPTTNFVEDDLMAEGADLWISGYKEGRYRVVPNTEVPEEFKRTGQLSDDPVEWYATE